MKEKAVIDRIEGSKVVLAVGSERDQYEITKSILPAGAREGDWLIIEIADDHISSAELDKNARSASEARISSKLDQLRKR